MKQRIKFLTVLVAVFSFTILTTYAQQGINYKAIISDNGVVLQNQAVQVQFSILRDGTTLEYQEIHSTTTDANGIIILNIGEGTPVSGHYNSIHWYAQQFLKVEIDTGGSFVDFGTTEFKTVPYAIYAENGNGAKQINDLTDAKKDVTSIFLGNDSGSVDAGNTDNTAIGNFALEVNTTGTSNNAIGFAALHNNITGYSNVANGSNSLASNTSGSENIAIGAYTFTENITGSYNTALGKSAGYNSLGNNNIFLGYKAGYNETGSDKLYIENSNSTTPLIGGDFSTDEVTINGSIAIVDGTQGINKVLTSDANGKASWQTGTTGATVLNDLTDAKTGGYSTFIGYGAGVDDDGTDNYNTGVGTMSLNSNTNGYRNTANGNQSLYFNTTGYLNTANGNVALYSNTTGEANTAIGNYSLYSNTEGNINVALGSSAGFANVSGSRNIFLGYNAGYNETGSDKLYIENSNSATPLIGGDFSTDEVTINGSIAIVDGTQGVDKVLTSDVNGKASWVVPVTGVTELDDLSDVVFDGQSLYLGYNAGINDDNSNYNAALGWETMKNNTSGRQNVSFGAQALFYNESGSYNVVLGSGAHYKNISGNDNVIIGEDAGLNTLGDGNILIGKEAGYHETGSNKLYIENSNSATPLIGGDFSTDEVIINGTLNVTGNILGNITATLSGDADMKAHLFGSVTLDGATFVTSSSDGFTSSQMATGHYRISSTGLNAYTVTTTMRYGFIGFISVQKFGNYFDVLTYDIAGVPVDRGFDFIVFKR